MLLRRRRRPTTRNQPVLRSAWQITLMARSVASPFLLAVARLILRRERPHFRRLFSEGFSSCSSTKSKSLLGQVTAARAAWPFIGKLLSRKAVRVEAMVGAAAM